MKITPVRQLQNEHLLNEFQSLAHWSGDDFALNPIAPNMVRRLEAARKEILRRMEDHNQQIRTEGK